MQNSIISLMQSAMWLTGKEARNGAEIMIGKTIAEKPKGVAPSRGLNF
jgi:hypothetical protein